MKYLATLSAMLLLLIALLWREVHTPDAVRPTADRHPTVHDRTSGTLPDLGAPTAAGIAVDTSPAPAAPSGGVRTWSSSATPVDGPDPFAPVPQIRSEADTRAGLPR